MADAASGVVLAAIAAKELTHEEKRFFQQEAPAGLTLFKWNISEPYTDTAALVQELQGLRPKSDPPFIVAIDQEGGRVNRFAKSSFPNLGPARHVEHGATDKSALAVLSRYGEDVGEALKQLGINVNFAPVCDILTNPTNKAIGDRVFGTDAESVHVRAGAFLRGLQNAGVAGCLKHFPGQGDAGADTHFASCHISASEETLKQRELIPFIKLIPSAPMVMLSHCVYPTWDDAPASLSHIVIHDILKGYCNFGGLVVSDDMVMEALPQHSGAWEESIVASVRAGVDLVLVCKDLNKCQRAVDALRKEAAADQDFAKRLQDASTRVRAFRAKLA